MRALASFSKRWYSSDGGLPAIAFFIVVFPSLTLLFSHTKP